jgi:1,4-alpha-glucan branching enzyme
VERGNDLASEAIAPSDLERLLRLEHSDPHSILGAHPGPDGVTIRALRPGADEVSVVENGARPWRMEQRDEAGLFEVVIKDHGEVFPYRLRVQYPDGTVATIHDPYSFLPTVGELDQLLWNEGRHERIHEKLGAHLREIEGVSGVAFAVWAPQRASCERGRRFQRLGRAARHDARAGFVGHLGNVHS